LENPNPYANYEPNAPLFAMAIEQMNPFLSGSVIENLTLILLYKLKILFIPRMSDIGKEGLCEYF
jgi:hypothetical protein